MAGLPLTVDRINKNKRKIDSIHLDDLLLLEEDLDYGEKVSLMFLLCAEDSVRLKVLLQQLIVASHTKKSSSNFLHLWAIEIDKLEQNPSVKWQDKSLEALCIIQEKLIITKLGLDFFDLDERFHASKVNSAVFIHPIAKLLYFICDKLTINEAMLLIKRITTDYASTEKFNYTDNGDHLELYLMHWIALDVISIGQNDREACNLAPIVRFLKEIEKEELTDVVKAIGERFNAKRAHQKSKIRTDDRRITEMTERSGNLTNVKSTREMLKSDAYKISKESAGILLIINQKNFHRENAFVNLLSEQPLRYRDGTEQDAKALKQTFKRFNYRIIEHDDVPHYEILTTVRDAVNQCHKLDSIIVCILSHGAEGIIYGSDSVGVHIDDIKKTILVDSLIGKPKILIIQACQGDEMQQAKKIQYDSPKSSLPAHSDFLLCISTVPGYKSIRHIELGSWYIQTLCTKISQLAERKHFADILTSVSREVTNLRNQNDECMVPSVNSSLRFDLFFPIQ